MAAQNSCIVLRVSSPYRLSCYREKGLVVTYVTAYCAKERYSTSTSRPLLSSFKNSLTHLKREENELNSTTSLSAHKRLEESSVSFWIEI